MLAKQDQQQLNELINYFNIEDIDDLITDFKTVFEMAAFETVNGIQGGEQRALGTQFRFLELLRRMKAGNRE